MSRRDTLVVSSRVGWIHDDLAAAAATIQLAVAPRDFGVDPPRVDRERIAAWWLPLDHAVTMLDAGWGLPFMSAGHHWLANLPTELTARNVSAMTLGAAAENPKLADRTGVIKLAEAKHRLLECTRTNAVGGVAQAALDAGLPGDARVEIADRWIPAVCCEHRHWVAGDIATAACYLHEGQPWNAEAFTPCPVHSAVAARLAAETLDTTDCPPAFCLDVAVTESGAPFILEANPAFSSGLYDGADLTAVIATLRMAIDHTNRYPQWHWQPDPVYRVRA